MAAVSDGTSRENVSASTAPIFTQSRPVGASFESETPPEIRFDFDPQPNGGELLSPQTIGDARALCRSPAAAAIVWASAQLERKFANTFAVPAVGLLYGALVERDESNNSQVWFRDWLGSRAETLRQWLEEKIEVDASSGDHARLSAQASHVVKRAMEFALATVDRASVDARHILAALVARGDETVDGSVVAPVLAELGIDLREFAPVLLARLSENRFDEGEKPDAWATILRSPQPVGRPDYASDTPDAAAPDWMNISPDVRAFAELICLKEARPPLSIGLFGDWGSGKTFFMDRLKRTVDDISESARRAGARGDATPFVPHIAQIRFNAWHYADANLWASLTAEFFDQLRVGGVDGKQGKAYDRLVGRVATHVRSLESDVTAWENARAVRRAELERKSEEVREARSALDSKIRAEAAKTMRSALATMFEENKAAIKAATETVYGRDLSGDFSGFADKAEEAATTVGRLDLIFKGLDRSQWLMTFVIGALVTIAGVGFFIAAHGGGGLAELLSRIAALPAFGGLIAALVGLRQAYLLVRPIWQGAARFSKAMAEARKTLGEELARKEDELSRARSEVAASEAALKSAQEKLAPYPPGDGKLSQASLLRYFLFDDAETRDYDQHLGIVSRVRRSFETLDGLAAAGRQAATAVAKRNAPAATPAERDQEQLAAEYNAGKSTPHRIVLYIDDLDRCTHEQVYQVLQAVHLLLAFELFVVVVGVDVRWVEDALGRFFTQAQNQPHAGVDPDTRQRATAYLEKIFQIPFWLRPLSTAAGNNSYGSYVGGLVSSRDGFQAGLAGRGNSNGGGGRGPLPSEELMELREASAERVTLTDDEVQFLSSPAIGALAGSSPRAIKRFINIYRLVRSRRGGDLATFTGEDGSSPEFPIVATVLAFETGLSAAEANVFYGSMNLVVDPSSSIVRSVKAAGRELTREFSELLATRPAIVSVLENAEEVRGTPITCEEWFAHATELRRYSFHRNGG